MRFCLMLGVTLAAATGAAAAEEQGGLTQQECSVWRLESDFAKSVDRHDLTAFASFIDPAAVFSAGTSAPLRGRKAILDGWSTLVAGTPVKLVWRPKIVTTADGENVAYSTGPFVLINTKSDAQHPYLMGNFITIWARKNRHAPWLVVFDSGTEPKPASSEAEALGHLDQAPATCPGT